MPYRAWVRQRSGAFRPRAAGNCASAGRRTSARMISPVDDARSDILCLISRALTPGVSIGTANPAIPSSTRAQTTATSATGAFVIHILPPLSTQSDPSRSEEHTSELQSLRHLVCRLLLE